MKRRREKQQRKMAWYFRDRMPEAMPSWIWRLMRWTRTVPGVSS